MRSSIQKELPSRRIGHIGDTGGEIVTELSAWSRGWILYAFCLTMLMIGQRDIVLLNHAIQWVV